MTHRAIIIALLLACGCSRLPPVERAETQLVAARTEVVAGDPDRAINIFRLLAEGTMTSRDDHGALVALAHIAIRELSELSSSHPKAREALELLQNQARELIVQDVESGRRAYDIPIVVHIAIDEWRGNFERTLSILQEANQSTASGIWLLLYPHLWDQGYCSEIVAGAKVAARATSRLYRAAHILDRKGRPLWIEPASVFLAATACVSSDDARRAFLMELQGDGTCLEVKPFVDELLEAKAAASRFSCD